MLLWVMALPAEAGGDVAGDQRCAAALSSRRGIGFAHGTTGPDWRTQQTLSAAQERLTRIFYDSPILLPIARFPTAESST